jgi:hypothetical protein
MSAYCHTDPIRTNSRARCPEYRESGPRRTEGARVESAITSQVVAVVATLSGVVLTLVTNAYLERRRARDAHQLESLRVNAEHTKWLRDERTKAYAALSLAGEEVLQFFRADLPSLLDSFDEGHRGATRARWAELRVEFRKACNQVLLLGAEEARTAGLDYWRTGRDHASDLLNEILTNPGAPTSREEYLERIREARMRLGARANSFIEACRDDLQPGR